MGEGFILPSDELILVLQGTVGALLLLFQHLWGNKQPEVREIERKVRSKGTQKHNSEFKELRWRKPQTRADLFLRRQKVWDEVLWEEENKGNQNVEQEEAANPNVLPH